MSIVASGMLCFQTLIKNGSYLLFKSYTYAVCQEQKIKIHLISETVFTLQYNISYKFQNLDLKALYISYLYKSFWHQHLYTKESFPKKSGTSYQVIIYVFRLRVQKALLVNDIELFYFNNGQIHQIQISLNNKFGTIFDQFLLWSYPLQMQSC